MRSFFPAMSLPLLLLAVSLGGCQETTKMTGTVNNVRLMSILAFNVEGDENNVIEGAAAGLVIAGPIGAVVGALAGAPDGTIDEITYRKEITGCQFTVKLEKNISVTYTFTEQWASPDKIACSLLRNGDSITITEIRDETRNLLWYRWRSTTSTDF